MIKQFRFFLLITMMTSCVNSQEVWKKYESSKLLYEEQGFKVNNQEFKYFLDLFYHIPLPLNYSIGFKNKTRIFPSAIDKRTLKNKNKNLKTFLNLKDEDFVYQYYDTDDALEVEVNKTWYLGQAFLVSEKYIGTIINSSYYTTDPVIGQTHLYIFNTKGEIQDSMILEGSINIHGIYDSFVLLDNNRFKTFRYSINEPNAEEIEYAFEDFYVKYKNKEGYRSKCVITDYKIMDNGKIQKIKTSEPILLKKDAWKYTDSSLPVYEDDPMNRDWVNYLKVEKE